MYWRDIITLVSYDAADDGEGYTQETENGHRFLRMFNRLKGPSFMLPGRPGTRSLLFFWYAPQTTRAKPALNTTAKVLMWSARTRKQEKFSSSIARKRPPPALYHRTGLKRRKEAGKSERKRDFKNSA